MTEFDEIYFKQKLTIQEDKQVLREIKNQRTSLSIC